jgi:hypothetical protein
MDEGIALETQQGGMMSDNDRYKIMLYRQDKPARKVSGGHTLAEAQAHCRKDSSHGPGWFHGYTRE